MKFKQSHEVYSHLLRHIFYFQNLIDKESNESNEQNKNLNLVNYYLKITLNLSTQCLMWFAFLKLMYY